MKIITLSIEHKIKHKEPIFSIDKGDKYIATSSMNGEVKLWNDTYRLVHTFKKHTGSISTIRFSSNKKFLASAGDDGCVVISNIETKETVYIIKHTMDVTHVEWADDFLVSTDLSGLIIVTECYSWAEKKRIQIDIGSIMGMCISYDCKWLCIYSEGILLLYKDLVEYRRRVLEKGVIVEMLNSRLSFAPNNRYISVGLQFNNKTPTVDVFDLDLNRMFSFIGHVAPSEITSFCPNAFSRKKINSENEEEGGRESEEQKIIKYYVMAIASQDLSISFWNTVNPKPFLLIKNFSESPVLDMRWDGLVLYISSYDGAVKKIEFEPGELGEVIYKDYDYDFIDIPYSTVNIKLMKSYAERREKLNLQEKVKKIKLGKLTTNFKTDRGVDKEGEDKAVEADKEGEDKAVEVDKEGEDKAVEADKEGEDKAVEVDKEGEDKAVEADKEGEDKAVEADKEGEDKAIEAEKEGEDKTVDKINREKIIDKEESNRKKIKVENEKLKRVIPRLSEEPSSIHVGIANNSKLLALFDTKLPDKLRITPSEPFKHRVSDFTIELNCSATKLTVYRYSKYFYDIAGNILKVCFNRKYLVLYTSYVQIYYLDTGCLVVPFISYRLSFMDLLDDMILLVNTYGDFTVLNLRTQDSWVGHLSKTKNLLRIELNDKYFILAEYPEEILFYNRGWKSWFCVNPGMNSIATSKTDWENDKDETLVQLDGQYKMFAMLGDDTNKNIVVRRIVGHFKRMRQMDSQQEYLLDEVISSVKDKSEVLCLLEELNNITSLQEFVDRMHDKLLK